MYIDPFPSVPTANDAYAITLLGECMVKNDRWWEVFQTYAVQTVGLPPLQLATMFEVVDTVEASSIFWNVSATKLT